MKIKIWLFSFLLVFINPFVLCAADFISEIPDSSKIRKELVEPWFEGSLDEVRAKMPEIHVNASGDKFQVRLEETDTTYSIVVARGMLRQVKLISETGGSWVEEDVYSGTFPGSWHLIKDKKNDKPLYIRYYYSSDNGVYIQFSPYSKIALGDMVIFGYYAAKGVSTGVPFETFYTASFSDAVKLTQKSLPWNYITVNPLLYESTISMCKIIHANLGKIIYTPDAMYDENNNLISVVYDKPFEIEGDTNGRIYLSSVGFIKWIADGLVKPVAGSQLKRGPLIASTVEVRDTSNMGVFEQKQSAYLALNWVRNISSAVISIYTNKKYTYKDSGVDVTINPFAEKITASGASSKNTNFVKDNGYNAQVLKSLLYVLAAKEPGTIYFGAIRQTDRTRTPEIKIFNDCVAFFPYFNSSKGFECKVYMNGREMTLESFCITHKDDFIFLTKTRSSEIFYPYIPE